MKVLIIQTAFPGDAILTLPLIQQLKMMEEPHNVDILCIPSTKIIFEASPYVSNVIVYDKHKSDKKFSAFLKLLKKLRSSKYDKVISPHRSARSAIISRFISAPARISFDKSAMSYLYTHTVEYRSDWHEVRRNLSLINKADNDNWRILPRVEIDNDVRKHVDEILQDIELSNSIIIAPGSVWETKKYPVDSYKWISNELVKKGFNIILIGGEEDKESAGTISNGSLNTINLCGQINFLHSIYLMSKCKLVLCNDSAPTHLAMCADASVLTIYCSTISDFGFYPYNSKGHIISFDDLYCKPCGIHGYQKCPEGHFKCAFELKPKQVLDRVIEILE